MKSKKAKRIVALTKPVGAGLKKSSWSRSDYISAVAVIVAGISAFFGYRQMNISYDALFSAQRAWIVPMGMSTNSLLVTGKPFDVKFLYRNSGKEPALKVRAFGEVTFSENKPEIINNLGKDFVRLCSVSDKLTDRDETIYPSENPGYQFTATSTFTQSVDAVLKGESVLYTQGCYTYETMQGQHNTAYCYYWLYDADKPIKEWDWRNCAFGNNGT